MTSNTKFYCFTLSTRYLFLDVKEVKNEIGDVEPLFGVAMVFDIKKKQKITENFHFDVNSRHVVDLLEYNKGPRDPLTLAHKALLPYHTREELFLVVALYRVLQGDEDGIHEGYLKANSVLEEGTNDS